MWQLCGEAKNLHRAADWPISARIGPAVAEPNEVHIWTRAGWNRKLPWNFFWEETAKNFFSFQNAEEV